VPETPPTYFLILALAGLVLAIIMFFRVRAGKPGSWALPPAFLAFSALGFGLYYGISDGIRNTIIAVLAILLVADVMLKATKEKR